MKLSEFRKLIREEVRKTVKEATQINPNISAEELKNTITPVLTKLEQQIDTASKNITIALTKKVKKSSNPSRIPAKDIMITRKGVVEAKKLIDVYNDLVSYTDAYVNSVEKPDDYDPEFTGNVLAKIKEMLQKNNL
jgi:hypothetical protein